MKILAFDNATSTCTVAILADGTQFALSETAIKSQANLILPMIDHVLTQAQLDLNELDAIAFGAGPGSFTGIRIACSVAQGLNFATRIPLISLSSLALLAQASVKLKNTQDVMVITDARMNQVYWTHYRADVLGIMHPVGEEHASAIGAISWPTVPFTVVTDCKKIEHASPLVIDQFDATTLNLGEALTIQAKSRNSKENHLTYAQALPVYLR